MELKECAPEDAALLAEMNKQLIEDEKASNPMDIGELKNRMTDFLNNGYKAFFFIVDGKIVGYALIDMTNEPKFLRQFFIKREERRKHYGEIAFNKLLKKIGTRKIEIDVLSWNETGLEFWKKMGFVEHWKHMRHI